MNKSADVQTIRVRALFVLLETFNFVQLNPMPERANRLSKARDHESFKSRMFSRKHRELADLLHRTTTQFVYALWAPVTFTHGEPCMGWHDKL